MITTVDRLNFAWRSISTDFRRNFNENSLALQRRTTLFFARNFLQTKITYVAIIIPCLKVLINFICIAARSLRHILYHGGICYIFAQNSTYSSEGEYGTYSPEVKYVLFVRAQNIVHMLSAYRSRAMEKGPAERENMGPEIFIFSRTNEKYIFHGFF